MMKEKKKRRAHYLHSKVANKFITIFSIPVEEVHLFGFMIMTMIIIIK